MRTLITGGNGMLAWDLQIALKNLGEVYPLGHSDCDITDPAALQQVFGRIAPELVINCAAYTDVDGCERAPEQAMAANAHGAGNVARAAEAAGGRLIHISTDYVFDGSARRDGRATTSERPAPYLERDAPNPISVYGRTKLEGEREVLSGAGANRHLVIRTSWLYGSHRANFVDRVIQQAMEGGPVKAVEDQISCLTWTKDLARAIARLISREQSLAASRARSSPAAGILHLAGTGLCTRLENAAHIVGWLKDNGQLGDAVVQVLATRWSDLNLPARRPTFSAMTSTRFAELGIEALPDWRASLDEYLTLKTAGR